MVHSRYWLGINYSDVMSRCWRHWWWLALTQLVRTGLLVSSITDCWSPQLSSTVLMIILLLSLNIVSSTSYSLISDGRSETGRDGSWWWSPDTSCCCPHTHSLLFTVVNTHRSSLSNLINQTCHSFIVYEAKTYLLQWMTPSSISL